MKKRIFTVFLTILLFMLSTVGVWASEGSDDSGFSGEYERLTDSAGLLSEEEAQNILTKLDEVSERQKFDIVILTVDSLEGATATEYADDFFDYYGYGYGEGKDGILFLVSMEDRDWALSTHGYGITAFTDAGCDYIAEQLRVHFQMASMRKHLKFISTSAMHLSHRREKTALTTIPIFQKNHLE